MNIYTFIFLYINHLLILTSEKSRFFNFDHIWWSKLGFFKWFKLVKTGRLKLDWSFSGQPCIYTSADLDNELPALYYTKVVDTLKYIQFDLNLPYYYLLSIFLLEVPFSNSRDSVRTWLGQGPNNNFRVQSVSRKCLPVVSLVLVKYWFVGIKITYLHQMSS